MPAAKAKYRKYPPRCPRGCNNIHIGATAATSTLLDIVNGSWMSQATYVAAHLGIADLLANRAQSADELAREAALSSEMKRKLDRLTERFLELEETTREPAPITTPPHY